MEFYSLAENKTLLWESFWVDGYCVDTVGMNEEIICMYVRIRKNKNVEWNNNVLNLTERWRERYQQHPLGVALCTLLGY